MQAQGHGCRWVVNVNIKKEEKKTKKTEEQAGTGSHRQGCGQASGHIKEKKSEHCIMCRQTCMFLNLNKT